MSRSSRFDKLESVREGGEPPSSGASLERFGAEPELSPRAEPVDPTQPALGAERLQRFDADGSQGLGLDRDPLALLPMLQCPGCGVECGKFQTDCHRCHASLTTPEARAHNLTRLEALQIQRAASRQGDHARLQAELQEAEVRGRMMHAAEQGMARELAEKYSDGERQRPGKTWWWWLAALVFFGAAWLAPWFGFRVLATAGGMICLLTRLPRSAWLKLGQSARSRDR